MMNDFPRLVYAFRLLPVLVAVATGTGQAAEVQAFFSPHGGCAAAIYQDMAQAKTSIDVMAYSLANPLITTGIEEAKRRGVAVRIVADRTQTNRKQSTVPSLHGQGIEVRIDRREQLMHTKAVLIDGRIVWCGSYNFSLSAENRNAECLLRIVDAETSKRFADNFLLHWNHAERFQERSADKSAFTVPPATFFKTFDLAHIRELLKWRALQVRCTRTRQVVLSKAV
jgi:phosphatidylserine/phosphatidylglycerophosphate/cardiolipin synthase-like enzyme